MKRPACSDPDFATASQWWDDLPAIWTPLGWREHMFRFNVFWNGTVMAQPSLNRRTERWAEQGLLLGVAPNVTDHYSEPAYMLVDDRQVRQGWVDHDAPVLWSEWARDGVVLREYAFAHIPGGGDTVTGIEPLFAWLRLTVHDLYDGLDLEKRHGFHLILHRPHVNSSMTLRMNYNFWKDTASTYPRPLAPESEAYSPATGLRILEEDGRVRLAVAPGAKDVTAQFFPPDPKQARPGHRLYLQLPARRGAHVDVLFPMIPTDRETVDRELALGYSRALKQTASYWRRITASPARFEVPEPSLTEAFRHSVRISNLLSERNPETDRLCKISGTWFYTDLWTTPLAMDLVMMMDLLGHHATVERYLDIFRAEQGTVKPPGDAYELHPGYLSTPARYKSIDWLPDNGAVLWTICMHYRLSGDRAFLDRFVDTIVKSCDWIRSSRAKTGHGGYPGVLPPAVASDFGTKIQAAWSSAWNYKGLAAAVRLLREIAHPRAGEFAAEADGFRRDFIKAMRHRTRSMPTWRDARGRTRRVAPFSLMGDQPSERRSAAYLDGGPLTLIFAGLMDADDPIMRDTLAWLREGSPARHLRHDSNCWQTTALDHEISSCEPCYSWNIFASWQKADRARFLEGMYSLFAGGMSRQTWVSCETRGGITGNVFTAPLAIFFARLSVIDDQLKTGELHLLRLMPKAWLRPGDACRFDRMPTEFGPVTLRTTVSKKGERLDLEFRPEFRSKPKRIHLHVPDGFRTVTLNGRPLPKGRRRVDV